MVMETEARERNKKLDFDFDNSVKFEGKTAEGS